MTRDLVSYAAARFALLLLLLVVSLSPAIAASVCSPPDGTQALLRAQFTQSDHRPITCGVNHDCRGLYVTDEGFLHPCNEWVKPGQQHDTPKPPDPCPATPPRWPGYHWWGGPHGDQCNSVPAGTYTGSDKQLPLTEVGKSALITDDIGPSTGYRVFTCTPNGWQHRGDICMGPPPVVEKQRKGRR